MTKRRQLPDHLRIPPELLKRELFDYQEQALEFMVEQDYAGLFLDMGMGKTAVVLHAILELPGPVLLVGPIRVIETVWETEAKQWAATRNLTFSLLRGKPEERQLAAAREVDVYLVNPELLPEALDLRDDYETLIIDESTMYKSVSTSRFKRLKHKLRRFGRRYILTGTPTPQGLGDLFTQTYILDTGERFGGNFRKFQERYFDPEDYMRYKWIPKPEAQEEITKAVADIVFRLKNPRPVPFRDNVLPMYLPKKAQKIYDQMEEEAFVELLETEIFAETAASVLGKLRQVTAGFMYDEDGDAHTLHREKIEDLRRVLDQTGSPVIAVYNFKEELRQLQEAFPEGVKYDAEAQKAWDRGKIPLLFLHPQSGGHGLNLQHGGHTMYFSTMSFSLEQMLQVRARIARTGQKNTVMFHIPVMVDTVDELLLEVLEKKAETQEQVLELIDNYRRKKYGM